MTSTTKFPPVPEHVPEALRQTYLRTDVTIEVDGETLDPSGLLERYASPVFVVTACNPLGEPLPIEDNDDRMRALSGELNADGVTWFPALGRDPYSGWAESSVAIFNVSCKDARTVGRRYSQLAIFELQESAAERVREAASCSSTKNQSDPCEHSPPSEDSLTDHRRWRCRRSGRLEGDHLEEVVLTDDLKRLPRFSQRGSLSQVRGDGETRPLADSTPVISAAIRSPRSPPSTTFHLRR